MVEYKEKPRILLVENDPSLRNSLAYILEKEAFDVICENRGDVAIELAKKKTPDLILIDACLPGKDGLMVCKALSKDRLTDKICLFVMSDPENITVDVMAEALEQYVDDFIKLKPWMWGVMILLPSRSIFRN